MNERIFLVADAHMLLTRGPEEQYTAVVVHILNISGRKTGKHGKIDFDQQNDVAASKSKRFRPRVVSVLTYGSTSVRALVFVLGHSTVDLAPSSRGSIAGPRVTMKMMPWQILWTYAGQSKR